MLTLWRLWLVAVLGLLPALATASSEAPQLLEFEHRNLRSGEVTDLTHLAGQPVVMMFFEPDCSWCIKQARILDKLQQQQHNSFIPVMLGVHGNRLALKRALFDLGVSLPAYQASRALEREMGGIPATPILLVADKQGHYLRYFRGLTTPEQLIPLLSSTAKPELAGLQQ
ncbi:TlpA family protein disulfide reductase [Ferrimonas kyonanensis]|uniref:TlpA family protein disulfide reductase n=1 Tax=Ferrimonas kyonanensis TaxID=364763 RepID=UPI0003FDFD53|nr:thioredoxin family protein [Ferrimonas kyonanensis]